MLNRHLLGGTLAAVCSATLLVAAPAAQQPQTPQPQTPQPQTQQPAAGQPQTQQPRAGEPQTQQPAQAAASETRKPATIVGCVYRERDVPGRAPNVAERVGILEDYILMEIPGATPGATASAGASTGATASAGRGQSQARGTTGTAGATGTAGTTGRMFKIEFVDDERLQTLVGRRVQVTGQIDAEEGDAANTAGATTSTTDKIIGRDQVNLSEFEVSSITEMEGTCPTLSGAK